MATARTPGWEPRPETDRAEELGQALGWQDDRVRVALLRDWLARQGEESRRALTELGAAVDKPAARADFNAASLARGRELVGLIGTEEALRVLERFPLQGLDPATGLVARLSLDGSMELLDQAAPEAD